MFLKIKDNVSLEELKKFGLDETTEDWILYNDLGDDRYNPDITYYELEICIRNAKQYGEYEERVLYTNCGYIPDIVYDLIKADLIEIVTKQTEEG